MSLSKRHIGCTTWIIIKMGKERTGNFSSTESSSSTSCPVKQHLKFADSAIRPQLTTAHLPERDFVAHVLPLLFQDLLFLGPNSSCLRCFAVPFVLLSQVLPMPNCRDASESPSTARSWWVKRSVRKTWASKKPWSSPGPVQQQEVLSGTTSGLGADSCWGADASSIGFAIFPQHTQLTLALAPHRNLLQKDQRQLQDHESSPGLNRGRNRSWLRGAGGWLCWKNRSFRQLWKNSQSRSVEVTQKGACGERYTYSAQGLRTPVSRMFLAAPEANFCKQPSTSFPTGAC